MKRNILVTTVALGLVSSLAASPLAHAASPRHIRIEPIRSDAPDWFTPSYARSAIAAGDAGVPLPQEAHIPMSSLAFTGIRQANRSSSRTAKTCSAGIT